LRKRLEDEELKREREKKEKMAKQRENSSL